MALPGGDKEKYHSVLEAAYGGRFDDDENSRLMNRYHENIWAEFEDAFHSKPYYIEEAKLAQNVKGIEHLAMRWPP